MQKRYLKKLQGIALLVVMLVLSLSGCKEDIGGQDEEKQVTGESEKQTELSNTQKMQDRANAKITEETKTYGFDSKVAIEEGENGWVYFFLCEYYKGENEPYVYVYNAYNMKYKEVEGFEVEMLDMEGNILGSFKPSIPCIILNDNYLNDIQKMLAYFEETKPTEQLNEEEESHITTDLLDKKQVVKLFDEMIESDYVDDGKYDYLPEADTVKEISEEGDCWQVSFLIIHGVIVKTNIEYIYDDEVYLSDKVKEGTASDDELYIDKIVSAIESDIVEGQSFVVNRNVYGDIAEEAYERLNGILQSIEKGNYR